VDAYTRIATLNIRYTVRWRPVDECTVPLEVMVLDVTDTSAESWTHQHMGVCAGGSMGDPSSARGLLSLLNTSARGGLGRGGGSRLATFAMSASNATTEETMCRQPLSAFRNPMCAPT
jgi:hypothetical protein